MKTTIVVIVACLGLVLAAMPVLGHHSFAAEFDSTKPVTLTGKFTKMDWVNPHSWIHMEAMNQATGKVETWDIETGPPNTLYRNGWRKDAIKEGSEIVVMGTMAKNGTNTVNARTVKTTEGNNPGAPVTGANSFTEGQAKSRIEARGFTNVSALAKDDKGIWRGSAMQNGTSVQVSLDFQGNVVAN